MGDRRGWRARGWRLGDSGKGRGDSRRDRGDSRADRIDRSMGLQSPNTRCLKLFQVIETY